MDIDQLVARCRQAPDDNGPRLVLADALLERGDAWGELIALSCTLGEGDAQLVEKLRVWRTGARCR